jgi:hypothetical protein
MKLLEFQRRMGADVMRPLTKSDRMAPGTDTTYVTRNDRLTSRERLELYNRQYWFRVIDAIHDDFPGLRAVLGQRAFNRLTRAYLADCPSRSFTLRNLGSRMESWLRENPVYGGTRLNLALDMARLEWAHIEAFDGPAETVLGPEDLLELGPGLRIGLQPYIQLLDLRYPVDDLRISVSRACSPDGAASNAVLKRKERRDVHKVSRLKQENIWLAVHRLDFGVYYRRLTAEEFRLLGALRAGLPIGEAVESGLDGSSLGLEELRRNLETWFATWAELGWFCRPKQKR